MRARTVFVSLAIIGLWAFQPTNAQSPAPTPASDRVARWRQDLKFFASEFASRQTDFAKLYPKTAFNAEVASLEAAAGQLSDAEITLCG